MVKKVFPAAILCLLLAACGPPQDGHGTREFDDGTKYVGEFKDGKRHGQGTATFPAQGGLLKSPGGKYAGEWKDDLMHGQGAKTWDDGGKFVGEWRDESLPIL